MTKQLSYHVRPSKATGSLFKWSWVLVLLCLLIAETSLAQNMGVNADGSKPEPSAMLDVSSSTQGFLMPRMTAAQRAAISSPAHGLMVLQIDGSRGIYIHDTNGGSLWRYVIDSIGIANMIQANAQTIAEVLSEGDDASNDTIRSLGAIGVGTSTTNFPIGVVTSQNRGINVSNNGTSGDQRGLSTTVGGSATTSTGVYGSTYGTAANASGVTGSSTASGTNSYGVRGETSGSAGTNYAVYGDATGGTNNYAGYFNQGDVVVQNGLLVNGYADVDSLSINSAFSFPTADGTIGQVMTTDGAGNLSWSAVSGDGDGIYDGSGSLSGNTVITGGANTLGFTSTVTNGFSVDSATFSVDAANNRVGFGTTTPSASLDVATNASSNATLLRGSASVLRLLAWSDGSVHIQNGLINTSNSNGDLKFTGIGGGPFKMILKSSGRLGVGELTPISKLHVNGGGRFDSLIIDGQYHLPTVDGTSGQVMTTNGSGSLSWATVAGVGVATDSIVDADGDTYVHVEETADEDIIRFITGGTEYFSMEAGRIVVNQTGGSIYMGDKTGINDDFGNNKNVGIGDDALRSVVGGQHNVAIGKEALRNNIADENIAIGIEAMRQTSSSTSFGNVAIGQEAGENTDGAKNIYLGYQAGQSATGSNQLYIDNSDTTGPLIYGDFSSDKLRIYGSLGISNEFVFPTTDGTNGQVMVTDGAGNLSWAAGASDGDWTIGTGLVYNSSDRFAVGTSTLPASYFAEFQTPASTSYPIGLSVDNDYTGAAQQFGLITNMGSASTGLKYGVYNTVTANTSQANSIYGVTNQMAVDGSGDAYGTFQTFSGTTTGSTYGFYSTGEDYNYMSGRLGIGTTTPTALLDVNGTGVSATGGRYGIRSDVDDGGNGSTNVFGIYSSPSSGGGGSNTYYGLYSNTNVTAGGSSSIGLYAFGATYAAILDGGNVGIGTTAPSELLHVDGGDLLLDRNNSTNVTRSIIIQGAGALGSNIYGRIVFKGYDNTSGSIEYEGAAITARNLGSVNHGALGFWTRNTTLTEWMRITRDGAVQIDPDNAGGARLQVTGDVEVSGHVEVDASEAYYFGDPNTDGSWRIIRSGNNLTFQRRESGSWVTKTSMIP